MRHRVPVQRASSRLERFPTGSCLGSHLALRIRKVLAQASGTREVQRLPRRTRLRAGTGDTVSLLPPAERVFFQETVTECPFFPSSPGRGRAQGGKG